jgi:hypothetical protein
MDLLAITRIAGLLILRVSIRAKQRFQIHRIPFPDHPVCMAPAVQDDVYIPSCNR